MEEVKKSQVIAAGWNYTQKRDILALDQRPVAPSNSRTYMGGKRMGRTKVGKRQVALVWESYSFLIYET